MYSFESRSMTITTRALELKINPDQFAMHHKEIEKHDIIMTKIPVRNVPGMFLYNLVTPNILQSMNKY